jgi:hypothetical protein
LDRCRQSHQIPNRHARSGRNGGCAQGVLRRLEASEYHDLHQPAVDARGSGGTRYDRGVPKVAQAACVAVCLAGVVHALQFQEPGDTAQFGYAGASLISASAARPLGPLDCLARPFGFDAIVVIRNRFDRFACGLHGSGEIAVLPLEFPSFIGAVGDEDGRAGDRDRRGRAIARCIKGVASVSSPLRFS